MGLLALRGVQNIVNQEAPTELVTARLSADTPEAASGRVLAALGGEPLHDRRRSSRAHIGGGEDQLEKMVPRANAGNDVKPPRRPRRY
jgi:hypothetical protein